jgi:OOP family OmpA-OmpF porin
MIEAQAAFRRNAYCVLCSTMHRYNCRNPQKNKLCVTAIEWISQPLGKGWIMKRTTMAIALLAALSAAGVAAASEFDGSYIGGKIGAVHSTFGTANLGDLGTDATTVGLDAGHNWMVRSYLLGVDAFADYNSNATDSNGNSVSSHGYGADLKAGLPINNWLPYVRLGYGQLSGSLPSTATPTTSPSAGGFHGGLGLEFKIAPHWGANAEFLTGYATDNGNKLNTNSLGLGLHYYFTASKVYEPAAMVEKTEPAPAPAAAEPVGMAEPAPAPAPSHAAEAEPAPAPQPKPVPVVHKLIKIEDVNFAFDSAALTKNADAKLDEVLAADKEFPDDNLEVSGYTDSTGKKAYNQKLSERRAASVKAWLVKHGIPAGRISTVGYGETKPVASNKTKAGRAQNRRVEVRYTAKE